MGEITTNEQVLRDLNISLKNIDDTFKYVYDILKEISNQWEEHFYEK